MPMKLWIKGFSLAVASWVSLSGSAMAGVSAQEMIQYGMPASMADYAAAVSKSEGNWNSVNSGDCLGAFQFCPETLDVFYQGTPESFLANPAAQVDAWIAYQRNEWRKAQNNGIDALIGQEVCYNGRCGVITASAILKACQFGCGTNGRLHRYFQHGDCDAANVKDGNEVSVCEFMLRATGLNVEAITDMTESDLAGNTWADAGGGSGEGGIDLQIFPTVLMPWETHKPSAGTAIHGTLTR